MSAKAYIKVTTSLWKSVNKIYVKVTPTLWKTVNKIYVKVTSSLWKSSFGGSNEPVQITKPKLVGTGRVGTTLTRTSGTYNNYNSLITKIFYTTEVAEQVSGSTTDPSGGNVTSTNPYTVVQSDATEPPYYFYARDEVVGVDNLTYYYYSTPPIEATVGTIEDNFNRTVASGLGTASSGFIYSGPSRNTSSWSVDGSRASNIYNGADYPLQTVTINSNNQNVSVDTFGGGLGVAVWVASANSWWAAIPTYTYQQGQGTDYTCTKDQSGTLAECEAVTYANTGSNPQSTGYLVSDVNKRCTICSTSTSSLYECTNNVRVTNAGDPCPPFENWSSAQPGGAGTVCSTACTESYEYICGSSFTLNQPDCTGELIRSEPTGEGQLCSCQTYQETVAICPSFYNQSGPCSDSNIGGTAIGDQCSTCNVSTTYAYSYRNNSLTTTYPCTGSGTCSGKDCCKNWTIPTDPQSAGVFCGNCNETSSTSTTYSYFTRASTGEVTYACNGSTVTGSATCPTYRPDPTGVGQNCSGCTPSTTTTYGSCKAPSDNDPSGCTRAPAGYTSCGVGFVRCPSTTTTYTYKLSTGSTTYLCNVNNTGSGNCPTSLPTTGSGPGQRCTACTESTSTTYSSTYSLTQSSSSYLCANYTTGQSSCPGEGSGPGQRCGACTVTTTSLYKTRIAEVQTRYKTIRSTKLTYNNYKTRVLVGSNTSSTWKVVEETTADKFTYKANIGIYSFSSGILTPKSTAVVSTYVAETGSQFSSSLYPTINRVAAVTTGDSINATGWVGSEFNVASSTNTGTKGTAVGVVGIPVTEKIGTKLDNFSA